MIKNYSLFSHNYNEITVGFGIRHACICTFISATILFIFKSYYSILVVHVQTQFCLFTEGESISQYLKSFQTNSMTDQKSYPQGEK